VIAEDVISMKIADLVLVRGSDELNYAIEFITHSQYSHVSGLTSDGQLIEAQGFQKTGYQDLSVYAGVSDIFTCDIATDKQRLAIHMFVEAEIGTRYDYLLIGWELVHYLLHLDLPFEERKKFICSTLWTEAYRSVGIDLCPNIRFPSPGDIALSRLLRKY
jgi:hypothetical protein